MNTNVPAINAQRTMTFGRTLLVDFVNRWQVSRQPAGRATIKGDFMKSIIQQVLYQEITFHFSQKKASIGLCKS